MPRLIKGSNMFNLLFVNSVINVIYSFDRIVIFRHRIVSDFIPNLGTIIRDIICRSVFGSTGTNVAANIAYTIIICFCIDESISRNVTDTCTIY